MPEHYEENPGTGKLESILIISIKNKNYKIIIRANLSNLGSSGKSSFSDWLSIC